MPPVVDVYVWVSRPSPATLRHFVERYVDVSAPGDGRLAVFCRVFIDGTGTAADLAELRSQGLAGEGFSLYLAALGHHRAIITMTEEGAAVLGLSIDDPTASPDMTAHASAVMEQLRAELSAEAAIFGWELPPPLDVVEWNTAWGVSGRSGL